MNDKKTRTEKENSVENSNNQSHIKSNPVSDRKIKWIKFWTGTMKYIMILPITALIIAPMITYLAPIAFAGFIVILQLTDRDFLVELNLRSITWPLIVLGMIFFFVGFIVTIGGLGQIVFHRLHKKTSLVQSHFYKHIRHPQSVGIILCVLGMTTVVFSYTEIVGAWALFWMFYFSLRMEAYIEEYFLFQKYKEKYITYLQKTGLFFPRLRKTRVTQDLWTPNPQKHLYRSLLKNFLGMVLVVGLIFIGCRLYVHFTSTILPTSSYTWEAVFNFDMKGIFYPDWYFINEIIAVSPLFLFWGYLLLIFFLKKRKKKRAANLRAT